MLLWLPFICAEFVNLGHERVNKVVARAIFNRLATSHSVLGGSYTSPDLNAIQRQALIATIPISFAMQFLTACAYVVAFMLIAKLIEMVRREQTPNVAMSLREITPRWRAVLLFSFKFYIAYGVLAAAFFEGLGYLLDAKPHSRDSFSQILILVVAVAVSGCVAWLLIPSSFRLVRNSADSKITIEERKLGVTFAALGSATGLALGEAIHRAERGFAITSNVEWAALSVMNLALASIPETLTFIALAVLSLRNSGDLAEDAEVDASATLLDSPAE